MQAAEFTPDIGDTIIRLMQNYYDEKHTHVAGWVCWTRQDGWEARPEVCYAPCVSHITYVHKNHPDHFGIVYQGLGPVREQNADCPEALLWMEHLVNPEGPFKDVLPFLYHTEAKQIIEDRGFVVKDLAKANKGLVWTFIQASRLMFEHPDCMGVFQEALQHDPQMAMFMAMSLRVAVKDTFNMGAPGHCTPLGSCPWQLAHNFLNGKVAKHDVNATGGSWRCFGDAVAPADYYRGYAQYARPMAAWVEQFNRMKKDRHVQVTAYRP